GGEGEGGQGPAHEGGGRHVGSLQGARTRKGTFHFTPEERRPRAPLPRKSARSSRAGPAGSLRPATSRPQEHPAGPLYLFQPSRLTPFSQAQRPLRLSPLSRIVTMKVGAGRTAARSPPEPSSDSSCVESRRCAASCCACPSVSC